KKLADSSRVFAKLASSSTAPVKSASARLRPDRSIPLRSQKAKEARAPPRRPANSISWREVMAMASRWDSLAKLMRLAVDMAPRHRLRLFNLHSADAPLTPD